MSDQNITTPEQDAQKNNDPRKIEDLYAAFEAADNIIMKKYVYSLSKSACIEMTDEQKTLEIGDNVSLYRLSSIVYDKNENVQDKLTTVYSTVLSLGNCSLVLLLNGHKERVDLFVGVASRNLHAEFKKGDNGELIKGTDGKEIFEYFTSDANALRKAGESLKSAFEGNFPGTTLINALNVSAETESMQPRLVDLKSKAEIIEEGLGKAKVIAAVSSIPALRNANERKNTEFIQGLEKLIDTMRGKAYSAVIIADAMGNDKIESMCAEYEDIYSKLAPFKQSNQTISTTEGSTDTEGVIDSVTDTINETVAKSLTHGTATSKTHTDSVGGSAGVEAKTPFGGVSASVNYSHAYSRTKTISEATTDTTSHSTAKSLTEQNSVSRALSSTKGESLQISYENRAVKTLLDRIDEQIKRLRSCEDFGMFDTCAYFAAEEYDTVVAAASAFKSITRGENSSIESSAVNIWSADIDHNHPGLEEATRKNVECIKDYLQRFYHPEFVLYRDSDLERLKDSKSPEEISYNTVTPALLVSGREMACQMALPKKSVVGVPVIECTEFGRDVITTSDEPAEILKLGTIFHMNKEEEHTEVYLNRDNLTAHTFITGSTGSGKSTTVYRILNEANKKQIKFLVVEPAKGEYKDALKGLGVRVFGTNPKLTPMLRINPFKFPSDKIHIYEHLDRLTELFNVCWPMYAAMPAVLKAAMENAYRSAGWNLVKSENQYGNIFPSFADIALEVERYINRSEYSEENKSNYKGSLLTRLESLTNGINGMIFTANDIDDREIFDENAIVDLSRVGSAETKALIMGVLVLKLQEYRTATATASNSVLKHITVLEEAHNLLKRTSTEQSDESSNLLGKSVEMLANSIAEMRTYGEGFVIADQSPGLLDLSVIRNTNTKIIMRLPDYTDRELVGRAANLNDDQIAHLAKLPRGVAAIYQSEWVNPVLCKIKKPEISNRPGIKVDNPLPVYDRSIVLDMLDTKFREKLEDIKESDAFRQKVLRSDIPTETKVKLLEYLKNKYSSNNMDMLASAVFSYFENAKSVLDATLENQGETMETDELRLQVLSALKPSIGGCDDDVVDIAIALIIKEYRDRYNIDLPVWQEFVIGLSKKEIK